LAVVAAVAEIKFGGPMARLTKSDIEQALKTGKTVSWKDASNKSLSITLDSAKQRRLFEFLLGSKAREVKGLSAEFVDGLAAAFIAPTDPATTPSTSGVAPGGSGPWKIQSITIEGFGGINAWNGSPFQWDLDRESLLVEGPNGSGKSSLAAAVIWALSGIRPRDQDDSASDMAHPVFGLDDKPAGDWCPVATYPDDLSNLKTPPKVSVTITFSNSSGLLANVSRSFDGKKTTYVADPALEIPDILLEAGLLMPARLPQLRLDEGKGRLTDAVQKLTGLDELIELGTFIQGLCHKGRDYLSYKSSELTAAKAEFERQVERARTTLAPVSITVPNFKVGDTDDLKGELATLGKTLNDRASDLTKAVSDDLTAGLDLTDAGIQKQVTLALAGAQEELGAGIEALPSWKTYSAIGATLPAAVRQTLRAATVSAREALALAEGYHQKEQDDTRYRLKAAGAQWHNEHGQGAIEKCPLCTASLKADESLRKELEELRSAGEAATRKLTDNINAILIDLEQKVPQPLKRYLSDSLTIEPQIIIVNEVRAKFVNADRYKKYLGKCAALFQEACANAPTAALQSAPSEMAGTASTKPVHHRIFQIELMCELADWFDAQKQSWTDWWSGITKAQELNADGMPKDGEQESISSHLVRLGRSLGQAEPYRVSAEAMRAAWKQGKIAADIEKEIARRTEITDALAPLKNLGNLAEAQARTAINELSDRIGEIHGATYLSERLQFQRASLEKKAGLVVRAKFSEEVRIDATLVANTSWLRGILWAFIFALREEAVEQLGVDMFPLLVLDDPQQTFDSEHRHRWAEQIANLQKGPTGVQTILTTHEEMFLSFLKIDGVQGRHALICSAGPDLGHIALIEGDALDRKWAEVSKTKTPAIARTYMSEVRIFVEGVLRLMLRGEDMDWPKFSIGNARQKISDLNKAGIEPWNRSTFATLAGALSNGIKEIKFIETAHHASGAHMGMTEATDVEKYWQKTLRSPLERAFRLVREHRALHGGLTALHAMQPTVVLPEGYKAKIGTLKFPIVGSAAALSDGRAADGCVDLNLVTSADTVVLKDHLAFRLQRPTLEPVARPGDILLVSEHAKPTPKSLIVALSEDRLLARRLQIADNHSDVAVLTANAINPRMIAQPVVAKMSTLTLHKVVGVIFDRSGPLSSSAEMEIADCGGEAHLTGPLSSAEGLVEVSGHSAEPHALDKQFLIIGKKVLLDKGISALEGHPVIAEDSNDNRYFKRLRIGDNGLIILESLEIGGDFPPVTLAGKPGTLAYLKALWPVLGVLFER